MHATVLGQHLVLFAADARQVAAATDRLPDSDWSQVEGGRLRELLPAEVLSPLYLAKVPLGYLVAPIPERPTENPRTAFTQQMRELARTSEAYGTRLVESPSSSFA